MGVSNISAPNSSSPNKMSFANDMSSANNTSLAMMKQWYDVFHKDLLEDFFNAAGEVDLERVATKLSLVKGLIASGNVANEGAANQDVEPIKKIVVANEDVECVEANK